MSCWMDPRLLSTQDLAAASLMQSLLEVEPCSSVWVPVLISVTACRTATVYEALCLSLILDPVCLQVPRAVALRRHQAELPPAPGGAQRAAPEEPGGGARPERRPGRPCWEPPPPHQINLSKHALSLLSCRMHLASPIDNPICVSVCVCALARRLACPVSVLRMVRIATTC